MNRPCKTAFRGQKTAESASAEVLDDTLLDVMATKLGDVTGAGDTHVSVLGLLHPSGRPDLEYPRVKGLSWKQELTLWTREATWPQASERPAGRVRTRRGRNSAATM